MTLFQSAPLPDERTESGYRLLVPIFDETLAPWTVRLALALARPRRGEVILVGIVRVPADESLSTAAQEAQARRATLAALGEQFASASLVIRPRIRVEYEPWRALAQLVSEEQVELTVVPWQAAGARPFFARGVDKLLTRLPCHVLLVSGVPGQVERLLVPLRGSTEAPLTLQVALALAEAHEAPITLLHAAQDDPTPQSQGIYQEIVRLTQGNPHIAREMEVAGQVDAAIRAKLAPTDLLVLGVREADGGSARRTIGTCVRALHEEQCAPLIAVKSHDPAPLSDLTGWPADEPLPATPTSVIVDQWFAENSFHSEEFDDLARLVALKEAQGLTISLGLPALNEEKTVGSVIRTMQESLMERFPLLDEIVLIDSGSTDRTVAIARELGVPVYQHSEILPQHGSYRGKGEALWKSLHVLTGDLIAWIDTDIVNIHPRFVYGLLGPLLHRPRVQYVKGFYHRPLRVGDTLQAGGGGRVTELVARPLLNLFYPELSGIVQPLSGEYAGRRSALERLPFYTGYGVETGLLLDLVEQHGISAIAQVDLCHRIHHNQPLGALGRMSFAIIQVLIDHLEERQEVTLLNEMNRTMKIIRYDAHFSLEEQAISDQKRPPLITLSDYRVAHSLPAWEDEIEAALPEAF